MKERKIYSRFIFLLVGAVGIPFLMTVTILFLNILDEEKDQYLSNIQLVMEQDKAELNTHVQNMYNIVNGIISNHELNSFLYTHYTNKDLMYYTNQIQLSVRAGIGNQTIYTAKIYHNNETIPRGFGTFYYLSDIIDMPSIEAFMASPDEELWLLPSQIEAEYNPNLVVTPTQYVYLKKVFIEGEFLYLATVSIKQSELLGFLEEDIQVNSLVQPQVLITPDKILINYKEDYKVDEAQLHDIIEHRNLMTTAIEGFPQQIYYMWEENNTEKLLIGVLMAIFLSILVSISLTLGYLNKFFKSLWECIEKIEQSMKMGFTDEVSIEADGEMGHIAEVINQLAQKIQELIAVATKQTSIAKESQLMALQQQINPHFMFNTLEAFCYRMELYEHFEEADAMVAFAGMLRYNLDTKNSLTTLGQEVEQLENYISIQGIKYKDIDFQVDVPKHLYDMVLLRFIIQPFVENSVKHGYEGKSLKVILSAMSVDDWIIIHIQDDGKGIEAEKVEELNKSFAQGEVGNRVGLSNISQRLQLFYGGQVKIEIESIYEESTTVKLKIPNSLNYTDLQKSQ